jgi:hypothetical protein
MAEGLASTIQPSCQFSLEKETPSSMAMQELVEKHLLMATAISSKIASNILTTFQ